MAIIKEHLPIIQSIDGKKDIIIYHLKNKYHHLPAYDMNNVVVDGTRVRIMLRDGSTRHLQPCLKGYVLQEANKFEIILKKETK